MSARPSLPARRRHVIIGAGVAGASVASALRRAGEQPLLLDAAPGLAHEASGRSAAMVRSHSEDEAIAALTRRGAVEHATGRWGPYRRTGSFLIGPGRESVTARVPIAVGTGRHHPDDGIADPVAMLRAFLDGVDVHHGVRVEALLPEGGGHRVVTPLGDVQAEVVVNAAGAWAGELGDLPLTPWKRHLFRSVPRRVDPAWPFVWDVVHGLYFRPEGDRLWLCACDETPSAAGDNEVHPAVAATLIAKVERLQPGLLPLAFEDGWAGQRTKAPDGRFVLGWDPRREGLFWVAGLGGHGITCAPAIGPLAARMLLAGPEAPAPAEAAPHAPGRLL